MEKNGEGTGIREILLFGKRIQVGSENKGPVFHENENEKGEKRKNTRWTTELHGNFLRAIQQLGGPESKHSFNLSADVWRFSFLYVISFLLILM